MKLTCTWREWELEKRERKRVDRELRSWARAYRSRDTPELVLSLWAWGHDEPGRLLHLAAWFDAWSAAATVERTYRDLGLATPAGRSTEVPLSDSKSWCGEPGRTLVVHRWRFGSAASMTEARPRLRRQGERASSEVVGAIWARDHDEPLAWTHAAVLTSKPARGARADLAPDLDGADAERTVLDIAASTGWTWHECPAKVDWHMSDGWTHLLLAPQGVFRHGAIVRTTEIPLALRWMGTRFLVCWPQGGGHWIYLPADSRVERSTT